jgi:hypothetical protein
MATLTGQSCLALVAQALPCDLICAGVVLLSLPVMPRAATSEWSRLDGWTRAGRP